MGATTMQYFVPGDNVLDAYQGLLNVLDADIEDGSWEDPKEKPGFVRVWEKVVAPDDAEILARAIMTGRVPGNRWSEEERTSQMPKFGPWYVIQCERSAPGLPDHNHLWLFFGWVNT